MIDEAKRKAASANDSASNTMDKLNDIKKEIDKINLMPVDTNLSSVLDNVDQSGESFKKYVIGTLCRICFCHHYFFILMLELIVNI